MRRRGIGIVMLLVAALGAGATGQTTAPIDQLDEGRLADQLQQMGMTELLEGLIAESGKTSSPKLKRIMAKANIARATTQTFRDPAKRNKLVDEAIDHLKQVVKATADANSWRGELQHFRDRLDLVTAMGSVRIEPQATAWMYLYGTEEDRKTVQKYASQAVALLGRLQYDLQDKIDDLSTSGYKGLLRVRHFRQVKDEVRYRAGWVYFFHGMTEPDASKASGSLRRSIASLEGYATGDESSGVKDWSMLVCGMARRELHQHKGAAEYLKSAAGEKGKAPVRMQAAFEIGRNLAEWGNYLYQRSEVYRKQNLTGEASQALSEAKEHFQEAEKAIDRFRQLTAKLMGGSKSGKLQADIYATILSNYLYETWSDALEEKDPAAAKKTAEKGLQAVLTFLDEHKDPAVQQFLLNRIAGKYAGRTDYENMPSLFVYSIALKKLEKADALWRAKETDQARELYDEVVKMMDLVQDRKDTPPGLQKDIGNLLGYIDNKLGRELEAARKFRQIARRDPSAEGAITAATNALKIYRKLVAERPTAQRKKEFIETLEFFLQARNGAWAKKEPQWHFDLAWQLESLGQTQAGQAQKQTYLRAVQAYEKVPKTTPEYMQARYRGLSLQMKIIDEFGQGNVQREQARKLIDSMQRFVSEAKSAIAETDDKGKVESMREWAARAQFESAILMSEVLGQDERALKLIDRLPEEWPGTRVLRWAAAFRIERLMKTDRVSEALAAFNEFRRKYGEEKARGLVQSLIREVRENIDELDRQGGDPARLRQYREVYVQFAKNLYVTSADESASRRYPLKQMYADALLEQGYSARAAKEDPEPFFKKALAFYQELYAFDQKRVKASRDKIKAEFKDKVTAVKSAGGNVRNMLSLGKQYIEDAAEDNYTSVSLTLLSDAVSELDDAVDEKDIQEAMAAVQFRMKKFLDDYRQWKLGRVPLDGANILGLARSHRLLGALDKANEFYRRWVRSAPSNHPQWWEVQYEYSETFYKISKDKPDDLKKLRMKIGQLQASDKSMGGERNRFALLLRLIKRSLDE